MRPVWAGRLCGRLHPFKAKTRVRIPLGTPLPVNGRHHAIDHRLECADAFDAVLIVFRVQHQSPHDELTQETIGGDDAVPGGLLKNVPPLVESSLEVSQDRRRLWDVTDGGQATIKIGP